MAQQVQALLLSDHLAIHGDPGAQNIWNGKHCHLLQVSLTEALLDIWQPWQFEDGAQFSPSHPTSWVLANTGSGRASHAEKRLSAETQKSKSLLEASIAR